MHIPRHRRCLSSAGYRRRLCVPGDGHRRRLSSASFRRVYEDRIALAHSPHLTTYRRATALAARPAPRRRPTPENRPSPMSNRRRGPLRSFRFAGPVSSTFATPRQSPPAPLSTLAADAPSLSLSPSALSPRPLSYPPPAGPAAPCLSLPSTLLFACYFSTIARQSASPLPAAPPPAPPDPRCPSPPPQRTAASRTPAAAPPPPAAPPRRAAGPPPDKERYHSNTGEGKTRSLHVPSGLPPEKAFVRERRAPCCRLQMKLR